jgi:hypothetical protein
MFYWSNGEMGMKKILLLIVLAAMALPSFAADIKISGDARVRPRWDIKDATDKPGGSKTQDFYYMYRARLKAQISIGDGWIMNTKFGHNGIGEYNGAFNQGEYPDLFGLESETQVGNHAAKRSSVDFMELNFGYQGDKYGFLMGLNPAGAVDNPIYDLHFYPKQMVDIAYYIWNNDAYYGGNAYLNIGDGQINFTTFVDDNNGILEEDADGNEKRNLTDQYTLSLGYKHNIDKLHFGIEGLYTLADDSLVAPATFGLSVGHKNLAGFTLDLFGGYSKQSVESKELSATQQYGYTPTEYQAAFIRLKTTKKVGPGKIVAWLDYANRTDKLIDGTEVDNKFTYIWAGYTWIVYSSDMGSFDITPRIRYQINDKEDVNQLTRNRLELEFNYIFK